MPKSILHKSDANRVTIYIWKSNPPFTLGHVSLKTYGSGGDYSDIFLGGVYASFWPSEADKAKQCSYQGVKGHNPKNLEEDIKLEGNKRPDETIDLYCLSVSKINRSYLKFRSSNCSWSVLGSTFFPANFFVNSNTKNCVGLVYLLLEAGDIHHLIKKAKIEISPSTIILSVTVNLLVTRWLINRFSLGIGNGAVAQSLTLISSSLRKGIGPLFDAYLKFDAATTQKALLIISGAACIAEFIRGVMASFTNSSIAADIKRGDVPLLTPFHISILLNEAKKAESELYELHDSPQRELRGIAKLLFGKMGK